MPEELFSFIARFPQEQRYSVTRNDPETIDPGQPEFLDADEMAECIRQYNEIYKQPGCVHDAGGHMIMISYRDCFLTVISV